jgi:serine/threonine-protein kinase RsbW
VTSNTGYQLKLVDTNRNATEASTIKLSVDSDLCYEGTYDIAKVINELLIQKPNKIVLDLSKVSSIDSSGLRSLLQARKACEEAGVQLRIEAASKCVERAIIMSGLAQAFQMPNRVLLTCSAHSTTSVALPSESAEPCWVVREYVATSDPYVVSLLRDKAVAFAIEAGATGEMLCDIQIAVGEALTNAFKHGSPRKGTDKIILRCFRCPEAVAFEVEDEGKEFDSDSIPEPDPQNMHDHGMGIYLMRQAMDEVQFQHNCPGNRVRMLKRLRS